MTSTELRATIAIAGAVKKQADINQAESMARSGMSPTAIGKVMGRNESSVRGLLAAQASRKSDQLTDLANTIRKRVDEDTFIDVGKGVEHHLGVTKGKLDTALAMLQSEGYVVKSILQPNATTAHDTRVRVIAKPGETWSSITNNRDKIRGLLAFSNDQGHTFDFIQEPLHLNPARMDIVYGKKGADSDGLIFVRQGVKDLAMDGAAYAQVRIQVGKDHYIKGMAVLKDGLPPGVDVLFHTSKSDTGNKLDALKKVNVDENGKTSSPLERFGAVYSQVIDSRTGKVTSHLNKVNDEEDWEKWSKSLATQMLSKQKPDFVKRQLDVTLANKKAQLDEIMTLTNPVVKKELLKAYADDMDASAAHLKAAALPRQKTHVLLPINSLKDHEVYAPGYKDGERVVLIRYPHGGKFEIPELVVNNRNREARAILDPAKTKSAIGINAAVARRLSGADFDGDTVVLIPNRSGRIQSEAPLKGLAKFDPQEQYRGSAGIDPKTGKHIPLPGVKLMKTTQTEMGTISNLITDMTIAGANHDELARAVRHSMVVIDAEKHGLDYTRSAKENGIQALRKTYQPGRYPGAATIISRTGGKVKVDDFKRGTFQPKDGGLGPTNLKTGEPIYVPTGKTRPKRVEDPVTGEVRWERVPKKVEVEKGSRLPGTGITDARQLVGKSGNPVEYHYADYSNKVRDLANQARLAETRIKDPLQNKSAKAVYKTEVESLQAKLKTSVMNAPRERQAQAIASVIIKMKRDATPDMKADQLKRVKANALRVARERVGAKPQRVTITDKEWEAIQAGAVSSSTLREVLTKVDTKLIKKLAQPKNDLKIQPHDEALARSLMSAGYTRAEIADRLGVSVSTLDRSLK